MRRGKKKIQFLLAVVLLMSMALSLLPYSAFAAGNLSQEDAAYTEQEQETDKAIGGETGDGETGDGETGDGETGDGEIGDGETGDGEIVAEGEVEHTSDELLDDRTAGPFKLSFAVPKEWEGNYTGIYVNAHLGSYNSDPWINKEMTYTGSDKDLGGMKVYEITLQDGDCMWDGYHTLQFQAWNGDSWYAQQVAINNTWTPSDDFADKFYVANSFEDWSDWDLDNLKTYY